MKRKKVFVISGFGGESGEDIYFKSKFESESNELEQFEFYLWSKIDSERMDSAVKQFNFYGNRWMSIFYHLHLLFYVIRKRPEIVLYNSTNTPSFGVFFGELLIPIYFLCHLLSIRQVFIFHNTWLKVSFLKLVISKKLPRIMIYFSYKLYWLLLYFILRYTDKQIIVSMADDKEMINLFIESWDLKKLSKTIEIENHHTYSYEKPNYNIQGKRICFVGFMRRDKGVLEFIENNFEFLKDKFIIIAGLFESKEYFNQITITLKHLKLEFVIEDRFLAEDEMIEIVHGSDFLILPYSRSTGPSGPFHLALSLGTIPVCPRFGYFKNAFDLCIQYSPSSFEFMEVKFNKDKVISYLNRTNIKDKFYQDYLK